VQRAIGHHVASRLEGLREARHDGADAILVGDLTDLASLEAALETATNGLS
jgi:Tfp pilus assembly pilus retraction ATPase PilT